VTLFALDSFAGGFVVQTFIAYWFAREFGTPPETLGLVFFAVGILQALSFQAARLLDLPLIALGCPRGAP